VGQPPLFAWYEQLLATHLVLAVLLGIAVLAVAILLFRVALKLFVLFLIVLLILIGLSYLFQGEAKTEEDLRRAAEELNQAIEGGEAPPAEPVKTPR